MYAADKLEQGGGVGVEVSRQVKHTLPPPRATSACVTASASTDRLHTLYLLLEQLVHVSQHLQVLTACTRRTVNQQII